MPHVSSRGLRIAEREGGDAKRNMAYSGEPEASSKQGATKTEGRRTRAGTHVAEGWSPEALSSRRLRRQTAEARSAEHEPVGREGEA